MYQDFVRTFLTGRSGRLLDIGCGLGYFLRRVSATGSWEGYGSEISPAAVRYAREKLGIANIVCGRPAELELPEQSFDVITLWDVIDHLPAPDPVLQRCRALLRNGGFCFIRTPNVTTQLARARFTKLVRGMQPDLKYLQADHHFHHYSTSSITRLLERNGFAGVEFTHLHPVQASNGWFMRRARNLCFDAIRGLAVVTGGRVNLDNLFVLARRAR
jgi:2-polyprenyl-3-methyl-5-hydroxy-6-metoxy-1,4-benzoquinol methylase